MKKLFMVVLGCTPKDRLIEQHDIFFGIAEELKDLVEEMKNFWPVDDLHIDCWKIIEQVGNYKVVINEKPSETENKEKQLFFINLGGYLPNIFEELHYKTVVVASDKAEAIKQVKATDFYKVNSYKGAESHIDDQYGIDIDEIFTINEVLRPNFKNKFSIDLITTDEIFEEPKMNNGYLKLSKLK
jgi:hypothetical protein